MATETISERIPVAKVRAALDTGIERAVDEAIESRH